MRMTPMKDLQLRALIARALWGFAAVWLAIVAIAFGVFAA